MGMSRKEFRKDINRGANFTDWRKDGKCIFYMHPQSDIEKRSSVSLRVPYKNDDGEEELRWVRRLFKGDDDPVAIVKKWLEEDEKYDLDDVIFRAKTKGGDVEEWLKGDLLAHKDYDWRKNLLRVKIEYLYCIANVTQKGEPPTGPEILIVPFSCAKKLNKVWDGEIEELGESDGDPWNNPYPCKVTYDSSESGSNMYDAGTVNAKARPLNKEVRALLNEEPSDMAQYADFSQEDTSLGTTAQILKKLLVVPCPVLDVDIAEEEPDESEKPTTKRRGRPKGSKNKPKETPEKPVEEPTEEKVKPQPPSKPTPKGESSIVPVHKAKSGVFYEYDDEPVEFIRWDEEDAVGIAKDEDGDELEIPANETLKKLKEQPESKQVEKSEPAGMYARDCEKGGAYYLRDGRKVTFKRYKESKDQAVFSDEDNKRVFVENASEEVVSQDATNEPETDPLEPRVEKKEIKQTKPKSKAEPEPEPEEDGDDSGLMCPSCDVALKEVEGGYKCGTCGVLYEVDNEEDDDTPPAF